MELRVRGDSQISIKMDSGKTVLIEGLDLKEEQQIEVSYKSLDELTEDEKEDLRWFVSKIIEELNE